VVDVEPDEASGSLGNQEAKLAKICDYNLAKILGSLDNLKWGWGVHFRLVWCAVTGNASNLASGRRLSTTIYCKAENNFSLFSCQASNPSNHKGFPRLHARDTSGKYFSPARDSGKIQRGKSQAMAAK
jgi:hypothetical protein